MSFEMTIKYYLKIENGKTKTKKEFDNEKYLLTFLRVIKM